MSDPRRLMWPSDPAIIRLVTALDVSRLQFAVTTLYHFVFVPITIGTGFLVAIMQTAWAWTGHDKWLRATKFFGRIFLINFVMGVVTGIVQEFQFGMNWSDFSRFVGDVFGAPLAIEGLFAFFLESTFLGLWIFGWDRLPKRIHLATIWVAAVGTVLSAYFIIAANSFMQHPVGYYYNAELGRVQLNDFGEVLFQSTTVITVVHVISAAAVTSGTLVAGISAWLLVRGRSTEVARGCLKLGACAILLGTVAVGASGDGEARNMVAEQPMKMAAAEALCATEAPASFTVFVLDPTCSQPGSPSIEVPRLLSLLATHSWDGQVRGVDDLEGEYEQRWGPGDYTPSIPVAFWAFRLMIGLGMLPALFAVVVLWVSRGGRQPVSRWWSRAALAVLLTPVLANLCGWILAENGRQPWVVFGLLKTEQGVSPTSTTGLVVTSLIVFTVIYGLLAVVEVGLIRRAVILGPPEVVSDPFEEGAEGERALSITY